MIETLYGVRCDKCGDTTGGIATSKSIAREEALRAGWGGGHTGYDYCPRCAKPIAEARASLRVDQWMLPDGTVMSNKFGNARES